MKKLIVSLAVVASAAAVAGGYLYYRSRADGDLATAAPADTLFYSGTDGSGKWLDIVRSMGSAGPSEGELARAREALEAYGPAGRMAYGLYAASSEKMANGGFIPGLGEHPRLAVYTIGLVPTMRLTLTDPAAFHGFVDEAEKRGEVTADTSSYRGVDLRSYPLAMDGDPGRAALVVAVYDGVGILTLDVSGFRDDVLPVALGLRRPETTVAGSGIRERIARAHDLEGGAVSFINHRAFAAALTGGEDVLAARMVTSLAGDGTTGLEPLRTPPCREDLAAITDVSPLTAFGWADGTAPDGPLHVKGVTEINDASLAQSLERLRGHLPAFLNEEATRPLLSFALALDMSKLAPVITDLWQRFTNAPFQCEWLVEAQQRLRGGNPAVIAMATAMVSSVRGISLSLYDVPAEKDPDAPAKNVDALLTLSAADPDPLIALAQSFVPALAGVKFPADGTPVALPVPLGLGNPLMASVTKSHVALFAGPRASRAAATLSDEALEPNGLFFLAADYKAVASAMLDRMDAMESAAASRGTDPQTVKELRDSIQRLADMNLRFSETLDIGDSGIVLNATVAPSDPR